MRPAPAPTTATVTATETIPCCSFSFPSRPTSSQFVRPLPCPPFSHLSPDPPRVALGHLAKLSYGRIAVHYPVPLPSKVYILWLAGWHPSQTDAVAYLLSYFICNNAALSCITCWFWFRADQQIDSHFVFFLDLVEVSLSPLLAAPLSLPAYGPFPPRLFALHFWRIHSLSAGFKHQHRRIGSNTL